MADMQRLDWPFPHRGVVSELDPAHIPPDALVTGTNMYYPTPNLLRARGGIDSTYSGSGSDAVEGMYYWDYDSNLYHWDDAKHLYKNDTVIAGMAQNVTDVVSFGTGATPVLIVCEDVSGGATLHTYTGSAYSALSGTDLPRARLVENYMGRLWATRATDYPSRVYASRAGDHTDFSASWDQAGWWDVAPGHDGGIEDWCFYKGTIYIFKEHGIYAMRGDSIASMSVQKLMSADQVVRGTVADVGRGVLYATAHGVFPLGTPAYGEEYDLSRNIMTELQAVLSGGQAAYSPEMSAYVLVDGTTTVWVSNVGNRPDVWTKLTAPAAMSSVYQGGGSLWFGQTDGTVHKYDHDDFEDNASTVYTVQFKTGEWDLTSKKMLKNVRIVEGALNAAENATATVKLYEDGSGTASPAAGHALTASSANVFHTNLNCQTLAMEITYTSRTGVPYFGGAVVHLRGKGDTV